MNNDIPSVNIVMPRIEKLADNNENLYYHVVNNKEDLINLFKYVSAMMCMNPSSLLNFHIPFSVRGKLYKIDGVMYEYEGVYKTNLDVLTLLQLTEPTLARYADEAYTKEKGLKPFPNHVKRKFNAIAINQWLNDPYLPQE